MGLILPDSEAGSVSGEECRWDPQSIREALQCPDAGAGDASLELPDRCGGDVQPRC